MTRIPTLSTGNSKYSSRSLLNRVELVFDEVAVCRDHPFHRKLIDGRISTVELSYLFVEQWHFHRLFHTVLQDLIKTAPLGRLKNELTEAVDTHNPVKSTSPAMLWRRLALSAGARVQYSSADPLHSTIDLIQTQRAMLVNAFPVAYATLMIGTFLEAAPWMAARREAFARLGPAIDLAYFDASPTRIVTMGLGEICDWVEQEDESAVAISVLSLLRRLLEARWQFFSEVQEAAQLGRNRWQPSEPYNRAVSRDT